MNDQPPIPNLVRIRNLRQVILFRLNGVLNEKQILLEVWPEYEMKEHSRRRGGWASQISRQLYRMSLSGLIARIVVEGKSYYHRK